MWPSFSRIPFCILAADPRRAVLGGSGRGGGLLCRESLRILTCFLLLGSAVKHHQTATTPAAASSPTPPTARGRTWWAGTHSSREDDVRRVKVAHSSCGEKTAPHRHPSASRSEPRRRFIARGPKVSPCTIDTRTSTQAHSLCLSLARAPHPPLCAGAGGKVT